MRLVGLAAVLCVACAQDREGGAAAPVDAGTLDAARPDAAAMDAAPIDGARCGDRRELGVAIVEAPAEAVAGRVLGVEVGADRLSLRVETREGATVDLSLAGPFADLDEGAVQPEDDVDFLRSGEHFRLVTASCDRPPLELVSGTWASFERWLGPAAEMAAPGIVCGDACPLSFGLRLESGGTVYALRPGEAVESLEHRLVHGRFEGCPEDPAAPSRLEYARLPRLDGPECPARTDEQPWSMELLGPDGAIRPTDSPLEHTGPVEVAARDASSVTLRPTAAGAPFDALRLTADLPGWTEGLEGPLTLVLHASQPWWTNLRVELADEAGLRFAAVDGDWSAARFAHLGSERLPAACHTPDRPDAYGPNRTHPLRLTVGEASRDVLPGPPAEIDFGGARLVVRVAKADTWQQGCQTDDPGGWVRFVLSRR